MIRSRAVQAGLAAAVILALPQLALAQSWYVGASLGHAQLRTGAFASDVEQAFASIGHAASGAHADMDRPYGATLFAGVSLAPWLAIELDYASPGTIATGYRNISIHGAVHGSSATTTTAKLGALGLSAMGHARLSEAISIHGRAGVARTRLRYDIEPCFFPNPPQDPPVGQCTRSNESLGHTRPLAGLGVDYRLSDRAALRVGWDRYFGVGKTFGFDAARSTDGRGRFDVDLFTLGMLYRY